MYEPAPVYEQPPAYELPPAYDQHPYEHTAYESSEPPAPELAPRPRRRRRAQNERTALSATIGVFAALVVAALIGTLIYALFKPSEERQATTTTTTPTGTPSPQPEKNPQP